MSLSLSHYPPTLSRVLYPQRTHKDDLHAKQRRAQALLEAYPAREMPLGLTKKEEKILRSVKRRAHYLDKGFNLCGLRFGWSFIIGIVPGAGDAADAALSYLLVIRKAKQADLPPWLIQRMLLNLALATSVGLVPIVGDILLAVYRANSRNAALLEEYLRVRASEEARPIDAHGSAVVAEKGASPGAAAPGPSSYRPPVDAKHSAGAGDEMLTTSPRPAADEHKTSSGSDPARSSSRGSKRSWRSGWRRSSKEKEPLPAEPIQRDSRFVEEDMGRSPKMA
ncbi:hypothetical protein EVG20_g3231 [Dentipellis fragilis]|uniref:DUF4112 domain-containing protein n=1 Tax=Dentipellis fragilis TaxID=205917 RepID=A0A4Y9Z311_9AGAM|nr:hypothetical protein EVG20_g3231 [Dentipellis fragilis]